MTSGRTGVRSAPPRTRREILSCARRLFAEQGYATTSLQQIATESGVAVQTIYSSIGTKAALVLALNDLIDEESGVAALAAEAHAETDPSRILAKGVHITRQLNERCGDLIAVMLSAELAEPDVADRGRRRDAPTRTGSHRHHAAPGAARRPARRHPPERAAAVFAMMTSPFSWRHLTRNAGWTFDDAETWLTQALRRLLLSRRR